MCIIVYKPDGVKLPSENLLAACFENNPHGAGYMFRRDGKIHIRKGFMTFPVFYTDLTKNVGKKTEVTIHFRYATHGKITPGNTHPFPVTASRRELHELIIDVNRGMCHNGILHGYAETDGDISDSAFFAKLLYPCRTDEQYQALLKLHNSSSKFVVMTPSGTFLSGTFVKKHGCQFSNWSFEETTSVTYTSPSYKNPTWYGMAGRYNIDIDDIESDRRTRTTYAEREAARRSSKIDDIAARRRAALNDLQARKNAINKPILVKTSGGKSAYSVMYYQTYYSVWKNYENTDIIPTKFDIDGKHLDLSGGLSLNKKKAMLFKFLTDLEVASEKKKSEHQAFEDFLRDDTSTVHELSLEFNADWYADGFIVNNKMTKNEFISYVTSMQYEVKIDGKTPATGQIYILSNARNITGDQNRLYEVKSQSQNLIIRVFKDINNRTAVRIIDGKTYTGSLITGETPDNKTFETPSATVNTFGVEVPLLPAATIDEKPAEETVDTEEIADDDDDDEEEEIADEEETDGDDDDEEEEEDDDDFDEYAEYKFSDVPGVSCND